MGTHPYRSRTTTCLFLQSVLEKMPKPVKLALEAVPGITSDSQLFQTHLRHHIDLYNRKEAENKDKESDLKVELLKLQLAEDRDKATKNKQDTKAKKDNWTVCGSNRLCGHGTYTCPYTRKCLIHDPTPAFCYTTCNTRPAPQSGQSKGRLWTAGVER